MAKIDSLNYIKDLIILIKSKREEFSLLTFVESYLIPTLISGGDGRMVALPNFAPDLMKNVKLNNEKLEFDLLIENHVKILNPFEMYKYSSSFVEQLKQN